MQRFNIDRKYIEPLFNMDKLFIINVNLKIKYYNKMALDEIQGHNRNDSARCFTYKIMRCTLYN